jgi:Family of unknown function (DUF6788)
MPDSLSALEADRSKLLEEFLDLGDLRPGSITAVVRRCGKPNCHCAKPDDLGHDPQFRLTRRVAGQTVTESFPNPAALRKAQKEVAEFRRFQKLSSEQVTLNERTCKRRPVETEPGGWTEAEKNGCCDPSGGGARNEQLLGRIFAQRHKDGRTDLEAIETAVRSTLHQAGVAALTALLQFPAPAADPRTLPCSCGQAAHYGGYARSPVPLRIFEITGVAWWG